MNIQLLNKEYEEKLKFPDTQVEETSTTELVIYNPYDTAVVVECIPDDKDIIVKFCPQRLEGKSSSKVILEYSPKTDRKTTLNGSKVKFRVSL